VKDTTTPRAELTEQFTERVNDAIREFHDLEMEQMRRGEIKARAKLADVRKSYVEKRDAMKDALEKATKASSAAWSDASAGLESAWSELRAALDEARAEFSEDEADEKEAQPA
jgi:phage host-nuclease inhibitor protein Gam